MNSLKMSSIHDLEKGDVFELEGGLYEVQMLGERIILAFVLDGSLDRVPDELDSTGYKTTAFSDLRYYREHNDEDLL